MSDSEMWRVENTYCLLTWDMVPRWKDTVRYWETCPYQRRDSRMTSRSPILLTQCMWPVHQDIHRPHSRAPIRYWVSQYLLFFSPTWLFFPTWHVPTLTDHSWPHFLPRRVRTDYWEPVRTYMTGTPDPWMTNFQGMISTLICWFDYQNQDFQTCVLKYHWFVIINVGKQSDYQRAW